LRLLLLLVFCVNRIFFISSLLHAGFPSFAPMCGHSLSFPGGTPDSRFPERSFIWRWPTSTLPRPLFVEQVLPLPFRPLSPRDEFGKCLFQKDLPPRSFKFPLRRFRTYGLFSPSAPPCESSSLLFPFCPTLFPVVKLPGSASPFPHPRFLIPLYRFQ